MKNFSNTYIFVFSIVMVVIVAILLSFVAMQLKPLQELNQEIERKSDILASVGEASEASDVKDKNAYIEQEFEKYTERMEKQRKAFEEERKLMQLFTAILFMQQLFHI